MATTAQVEAIVDAKLLNYPNNQDIDSFWLITNAEFGIIHIDFSSNS